MSVALLNLVESRLADHRPKRHRLRPFMKRCAVALVLQVREGELCVLMIRRAERPGDPWSGQMAFPGGRMERIDAHGFATAVRETEEEVGLVLDAGECVGRLSEVNARSRIRGLGMAVSPFVFRLRREVAFAPNHEVAEVVWVPLEFLLDTDNRETMVWERKPVSLTLPCYFYEGRRIWGLSLRMLDELMDLVTGPGGKRPPGWRY
ncbi:MAG: NUDIX hydrolase [Pseudohaliea sp.]